jgi:hypothetical protein
MAKKLSKKTRSIADIIGASNREVAKNIDALSSQLSELTNLIIEDRKLKETESKKRSSLDRRIAIQDAKQKAINLAYESELKELSSERRSIGFKINSLLAEEKKIQAEEKKKSEEEARAYTSQAEKAYASGDFVSGLFLSFLGRNEPTKEEQKEAAKKEAAVEREALLGELEKQRKDLKEQQKALRSELKTELKSGFATFNKSLIELKEDETAILRDTIDDVSKESIIPKIINVHIVSLDKKIHNKIDKLIDGVNELKYTNKGFGLPFTGNQIFPSGNLPKGTSTLGRVGRLAGKAAIPLTIAMGAYDAFMGGTDIGVNKILPSRRGKETTPISLAERVRSGKSSMLSGLTLGFISPETIAKAMESPFGQLIEKMGNILNPLIEIPLILEKLYDNLPSVLKTKPKKLEPSDIKAPSRESYVSPSVKESIDKTFEDPKLKNMVQQIIISESGGKKDIINAVGAAGLYQFTQSTAKDIAKKTGREDIIREIEGTKIIKFTEDPTVKTLSKQGKSEELSQYIKATYPESTAVAVSKLSEEQQTAMYKQFLRPLIEYKGSDIAVEDIKSYGFAPKYLDAVKSGNMNTVLYDRDSQAFKWNPVFEKWDLDRNGLTAQELLNGVSSMMKNNQSNNTTKKQSPSKITPYESTSSEIKSLESDYNKLGNAPENSEMRKTLAKKIQINRNKLVQMEKRSDLRFKEIDTGSLDYKTKYPQIYSELDKERSNEISSGRIQKDIYGNPLSVAERLRYRQIYEDKTGLSSSEEGLSYNKIKERVNEILVQNNTPKSSSVNVGAVVEDRRAMEPSNTSPMTSINAPTVNNISNNTVSSVREKPRDVFYPESMYLQRIFGIPG